MQKTHGESKDAGKTEWLAGNRKRIEILVNGRFEKHGTFSKYVWITRRK
ncbi:MAG: hypothetical protein ABIH23_36160 [bacterium]